MINSLLKKSKEKIENFLDSLNTKPEPSKEEIALGIFEERLVPTDWTDKAHKSNPLTIEFLYIKPEEIYYGDKNEKKIYDELGEKERKTIFEEARLGNSIYEVIDKEGNRLDGFKKKDIINALLENNNSISEAFDELSNNYKESRREEQKQIEKAEISNQKAKLQENDRKRKIREKAEKEVYGSIKTKRLSFDETLKDSVFSKYDNSCAVCGYEEGLHIHHKDKNPRNNKLSNLVLLCGVCHKKVHMRVR
ncbi:HNH endonuclease [Candidatus Woesearchaeota archaeon]|nr:HNH endonuclease [Candidatus Woesearchaeota archaeon]